MKYFIKCYGCAMNVSDSEKLAGVLESAGYESTSDIEQADIVLVNTCVVRQTAEDRAAWFVTSLKGLKKNKPKLKIGLCGCIVTEPGRDVRKQFSHVDFFIPPNSSQKLAELLRPSPFGRGGRVEGRRVRAEVGLVTITHGCDNFCSYCVVPYVRGRETSRSMKEVLAEIKTLIEQGVTDITLLGQNVNSYKFGLAALLREIHSFDICHGSTSSPSQPSRALSRDLTFVIRFQTSHPRDMSDEIIQAVAELPYVAKEFHLPVQSGDNEILKKMNRGYTVEYYKDRIKKIRSLMPSARVTTDMLAGFPGETEEQFERSLTLVGEIGFNAVNMFAYSVRPMTASAKLPDQLPEEIKRARLQKLIETVRRNVIIARGG